MRLAIVASHPIQYHAPLYRALAQECELKVFYAHSASPADQARAGFNVGFAWDVDLLGGYEHVFLDNVAADPGVHHFRGCDTPGLYRHLAEGFDAVLISGWHLKTFLQALFYAKRLGIGTLVRGDSQLETPRSRLKTFAKAAVYPTFLRRFDAALYVGSRSKAYWKHYGYPEHRLHRSPHCVDTQWFAERAQPPARQAVRERLGIGEAEKVLLFAGKTIEFKRPLDLVRAAERMRGEGVQARVLVAGSGALDGALRDAAAAAKVQLSTLGFCNQSEMPAAYAAADLLVLPSTGRETWGLVANEALACGTPILLSDAVGSASDLAADGTAGATFPLGDIGALAAAAIRLLRAPPSADAIREKSDAYSVEAAAAGILAGARAVSRRS